MIHVGCVYKRHLVWFTKLIASATFLRILLFSDFNNNQDFWTSISYPDHKKCCHPHKTSISLCRLSSTCAAQSVVPGAPRFWLNVLISYWNHYLNKICKFLFMSYLTMALTKWRFFKHKVLQSLYSIKYFWLWGLKRPTLSSATRSHPKHGRLIWATCNS